MKAAAHSSSGATVSAPADAVKHTRRTPSRRLARLAAVALGAAATFIGVTAVRVEHQASVDETRPVGAIIVFGAAEYSGHPSPVYRARLDHAYELFERGVAPLVITTGGAARDPKFSEGGVGRDYLKARGIPDLNLIAETQSDDTAQSAQRTANILRVNGVRQCVAVSDAYHMFRVKHILEAEGVTVYASPRPGSIPHTRFTRALTALREGFSYLLWELHLT
jgi:uncharacterized SAM-binding protein YcdF (DUF218 family)